MNENNKERRLTARARALGAVVGLCGALLPAALPAAPAGWAECAPEALPLLTVRWEDPGQREVFLVEGERYQCRVATHPARILSLSVDGKDLLGPAGIAIGFADGQRNRYLPAPPGTAPSKWTVWRRKWVPSSDTRSRMNVWSAGPYYWDAHLLDIPLVSEAKAKTMAQPLRVLASYDFDKGDHGWKAQNSCTIQHDPQGILRITNTGDDPYIQIPEVSLPGPLQVAVRMRTRAGTGGAFYWADDANPGYSGQSVATFGVKADDEWREYRVPLAITGSLKRLRFDPPGSSGTVDVDWLRIEALPKEDPKTPGPSRGEVIFHAFPDQLRIEVRAEPSEGQPPLKSTLLVVDGKVAPQAGAVDRPIGVLGSGTASAAVLAPAGATFAADGWRAPASGSRPGACWVVRPLAQGQGAPDAFREELDPLPASAVEVTGGHWLGYDPISGLYRIQAALNPAGYGFEAAFTNPNRRVATGVRLRNGTRPRRMVVKCETGIGCLEAAVLADAHGFPLPAPVFVAKNFAGELEEPDDSAFGDSYFPLSLAPGEDRAFQVLHLMQNWGNHPLKQVSSIRFFNIYWHLSTGVSESTCYTLDYMAMGRGASVRIPDYRPMSGEMWPGQPQHDCQQWPGFLQYNDGKVRLLYDRTAFESVSPNLTRYTMYFHTSDGAATARLSVMEMPQRDEMRTFVRLRYDWQKPVEVQGDARLAFRWLNVYDKRQPEALLWTAPDGKTRSVPVTAADKPLLVGELLSKESPFVACHGRGDSYSAVSLVRSFQAKLGGRTFDQPALSALYGPKDGDHWLSVPVETLKLQPGDFVEADLMLMPHGEPTLPLLKPERERKERFGAGIPVVKDVAAGTKLADFPARVRAAEEVALFTLEGGYDFMPLIVEGFREWGVPLLWRDGLWQDQQVAGGDGYQVEADGSGGYRFIFLYPIRKEQKIRLLVTRASCTTGIARVRDLNGFPVIEAAMPGEFSLKAPVLFAPGRNIVTAGAPVIRFAGSGAAVRAVPVTVAVSKGEAEVTLNETATEVKVKGAAATVTFGQLARGATYVVTVNGRSERRTAGNGALEVKATGPETTLTIRRE